MEEANHEAVEDAVDATAADEAPDAAPEADAHGDDGAAGEPGETVSVDELQRRLDEATARADEYLDRLQRLQADFDNFRKRKARQVEDERRRAGERLITELLDVLGNFDRALDGASGGDESLHDGVALIYKQLRGLLEREGVERIEAEGHPFDPEVHEAVMREETDAYEEGVIIKELEKGYTLRGRVLRPAKVKVATKPVAADEAGQ